MNIQEVSQKEAELRQLLQHLSLKCASLQGTKSAMEERKKSLLTKVGEAKARDGLSPEVGVAFKALQQKTHDRSVGSYEELLTYLLKDVLPQEGTVHLQTDYKGNETWLDVFVKKPGFKEKESLNANGGALNNVISTGLRYISLSKTENRKFLILDEPDCWVENNRVESFFKVISEVSASVGFQTFFISHHDSSMFEGNANIVKLRRMYADELKQIPEDIDSWLYEVVFEDGAVRDFASLEDVLHMEGIKIRRYKVVCEQMQPIVSQWEDATTPGIRAIELINVRQHQHTVIPCGPGANALIGGNNVGKSTAILVATRAMAYGECDDTIIRHGQDEATIIFHIEDGKRLVMTRKKGRSPPIMYYLYQGDECLKEGKPQKRNSVPDWVEKELGICRVDDMDIQLVSQKSPIFLLEESGPKRAKILSVGTEGENLTDLMKIYENIKSEDKETIKRGEEELTRLNMALDSFKNLTGLEEILAELMLEFDQMWKNFEDLKKMFSVLTKLDDVLAKNSWASNFSVLELPDLTTPTIRDTTPLEKTLKTLETPVLVVPELTFDSAPALKDSSILIHHGKSLVEALKANDFVVSAHESMEKMEALFDKKEISLKDTSATDKLLMEIQEQSNSLNETVKAQNKLVEEIKHNQATEEAIIRELGGICPTCSQRWPEGYHSHV